MNKKILIFADYFLPGDRAGGPVTSISNLHRLLADDFSIIIATRNHDINSLSAYNDVEWDRITHFDSYSVIYLSSLNVFSIAGVIHNIEPDFIYLNSLFSLFTQITLLLLKIRAINSKIVLATRGELQKNALSIKRKKKYLYIKFIKQFNISRFVSFHATDVIELDSIKNTFPQATCHVISNVPRFLSRTPRFKRSNEIRIIFAGRILKNKNLHYAIDVISKCSCSVVFDIYGPVEDRAYWDDCLKTIAELPENILVSYKGSVATKLMSMVYSNYHALLLPTVTENFGHAIVEAMQSGVVPIISNQTPWRELEVNNAGWDIDLSRPDLFLRALEIVCNMNDVEYQIISESVSKFIFDRLDFDGLRSAYIKMFN